MVGLLKGIESSFLDLEWMKWQNLIQTDKAIGQRVIASVVCKSKVDSRRFNLNYGMGKNSNQVKLLAQTE